MQGPAGIVVDAGGNPVGSALRLEGLGATPRALAASGPFLLVASEAGIHVFDRDSGSEVQRLAFAPELRPQPGQPLYAVAGGGSGGGGSGGGGECVAVAGRRLVWLCLPVPPEDQARELLARGDHEAAAPLIEAGLQQGAGWAQVAAAQAALLLLQGELGGLCVVVLRPTALGSVGQLLRGCRRSAKEAAFRAWLPLIRPCPLQNAGLKKQSDGWSSAAPPPSSQRSSSRSSLPTRRPGQRRWGCRRVWGGWVPQHVL